MTIEEQILTILIRGGFILFAAWLVDVFLLRRIRASISRWTWMCVFTLLLFTPMSLKWQLWHIPRLSSLGIIEQATPSTSSFDSSAHSLPTVTKQHNVTLTNPSHTTEKPSNESTKQPSYLWLSLWLTGVVSVIFFILCGRYLSGRIFRRAEPADTIWQDAARLAASDLNLQFTPEVLSSSEVSSPTVIGLIHPKVLVPPSISEYGLANRKTILLHEFAHIHGRDPLLNFLSQLIVAIHWCNPFAWLAFNAFRFHQERRCDDESLLNSNAQNPNDYASLLVSVARSGHSQFPLTAQLSLTSKSTLERRIRLILNQSMQRKSMTNKLKIAVSITALGILSPLALTGAEKTALKQNNIIKLDKEAGNNKLNKERKTKLNNVFAAVKANDPKALAANLSGVSEEKAMEMLTKISTNWGDLNALELTDAKQPKSAHKGNMQTLIHNGSKATVDGKWLDLKSKKTTDTAKRIGILFPRESSEAAQFLVVEWKK